MKAFQTGMTMNATVRKLISRVLIGVILFAQWTVASYACSTKMESPTTDAALIAVSAHHRLHNDVVNLCLEHCRYGQQSADTASVPLVQPAVLSPLYRLLAVACENLIHRIAYAGVSATAVAPQPVHSILHCCLRN